MKIKDIIEKEDFIFNFAEYCKVEANDYNLFISMNDKINPNEEITLIYYWYDHLTRGSQQVVEIETSLQSKNWTLFAKYYYNEVPHRCTLPIQIAVFSKITNKFIGHLLLNEKTFSFIDYSEYKSVVEEREYLIE